MLALLSAMKQTLSLQKMESFKMLWRALELE
jgi:hypothetical protein